MQGLAKQREEPHSETPNTIKNVWAYNCEKEFLKIAELLQQGYNYVAMDTEFPGFLYDYNGGEINPDIVYSVVKMNVDKLNAIQIGITLADEKGNKPDKVDTWQFNLNFNTDKQHYAQDSINLLKEAGIKFEDLAEHGIDHMVFGDYLMSSGLVINSEVRWITFHGCYDFAYLIKLLLNEPLPTASSEFTKYLQHLFPKIYDVKVLISDFQEMKNDSLSKLAMKLDLKRTGITHQAGSDALLTANVFFKIKAQKYPNDFPESVTDKVFGLSFGTSMQASDYQAEMYNGHMYQYQPYTFPYNTAYPGYAMYPTMGHEYFYTQQSPMPGMMATHTTSIVTPYPAANPPKENKKK